MSIQSQINRIAGNISDALAAITAKGVTVPSGSDSDDLATLIAQITTGDPSWSVSQSLTHIDSSFSANKVTKGAPLYIELEPDSGYVISSITVTMGGVDITDQVFKPGLGAKKITANGTYSPEDDSLGGYERVQVQVPSGSATLDEKTITQNGTYNASDDSLDGYSKVTVNVSGGITPTGTKQISVSQNGTTTEDVTNYASAQIVANVPNSYAAGDEGKVVSNGALVAQGSDTCTQNGTVDTTLINSLVVNVGGGGAQVETGEITLTSDFPLTTSPQNIPNLQLSFQPDFFYIIMNRPSFTSVSSRSAGLYGLIAVKRNWSPPFASSASNTPETASNDYTFLHYVTIYTNSNISTGVGLGNHGQVGASYYGRYSVNANGTISVGRYSSASTKMFAGTYRYFAVKLP